MDHTWQENTLGDTETLRHCEIRAERHVTHCKPSRREDPESFQVSDASSLIRITISTMSETRLLEREKNDDRGTIKSPGKYCAVPHASGLVLKTKPQGQIYTVRIDYTNSRKVSAGSLFVRALKAPQMRDRNRKTK